MNPYHDSKGRFTSGGGGGRKKVGGAYSRSRMPAKRYSMGKHALSAGTALKRTSRKKLMANPNRKFSKYREQGRRRITQRRRPYRTEF